MREHWRAFRDWAATEWREWCRAWQDVRQDSRRGEMVTVPLEKYYVLLEAETREANALRLLGNAQETIRLLGATVAKQDELITLQQSSMERETQALIDRKVDKPLTWAMSQPADIFD